MGGVENNRLDCARAHDLQAPTLDCAATAKIPLADHFTRAHAPGLELDPAAAQLHRHNAGFDDEQMIADLSCRQDHLPGATGWQAHGGRSSTTR